MAKSTIKYPREVEGSPENGNRCFFVETDSAKSFKSRTESIASDLVTIFPFDRDYEPKFTYIRSIAFEGFRKSFPRGFFKDWPRGYGPTRTFAKLFFGLDRQLQRSKIVISKTRATSLSPRQLVLNWKQLDTAFPLFSALFAEHKEDFDQATAATLHDLLPGEFPGSRLTYKKGGLASYIKKRNVAGSALSVEDSESLLKLLKAGSGTLDKTQVLATKQLIEEFYIEDVIDELQTLLKRAGAGKIEEEWQKFFVKYNWIFSQFFSSPVMLMKDKAYVGGKTIDDSEGKVADFLYQNSLTKSVAIIEIKTHKTRLMKNTAYRGTDVFPAGDDLTGGIGQVLNQRDNLQKEYYDLAKKSGKDFETQNSKCVVLIGMISSLKPGAVASFELFRGNSKEVEIYTFDEVLARLKALQKLIKGDRAKKKKSAKAS